MSNLTIQLFNNHALMAAISALGLFVLLLSSGFDLVVHKIPNMMVVMLVPLGLLRHGLEGDVWSALAAASVVLLAAMLVWYHGLLGGADVKLLAAAALLVPLDMMTTLFLVTALVGAALALVAIALRPIGARYALPAGRSADVFTRLWHIEARRLSHGHSMPYVVAITIGTGWAIWLAGG
jgi:Flp pilus assembly protein protease CpaA